MSTNTITTSGKNVFSNGKVVGQYQSEGEAQAAAAAYTSGSSKNVAGATAVNGATNSKNPTPPAALTDAQAATQAEQAKQTGMGAPVSMNAESAQKQGLETPEQTMDRIRISQGLPPLYRQSTYTPAPYAPPVPPAPKADATVTAPTVLTSSMADTQTQKDQTDLQQATNGMNTGTNTGSTTTGSTTSSGTTGTSDQNVNDQLTAVNDALDSATATYNANIASIMNGTFALSPSDQATISGIQANIDAAVANQKAINGQMAGAVTQAGIRNGLQRYAPEVNAGLIGAQLSAGAAKIAEIEAQGQSQIAAAQQAIEDKDFKLLNTSMDEFRATMQTKSATIQQMFQNTLDYQKFTADQAQQAAKAATETVDTLIAAGKGPADLSQNELDALDAKSGWPQGTTASLLQVGQQQAQAAAEADQAKAEQTNIENASKLIDTLTKLPVGQTVDVNGVTYSSLNPGKVQVFSEDDGQGNTTIISYNQDTGAMSSQTLTGVSKQDGWQFTSQNGVGLFVNAQTGQTRVAFDGNQYNKGQPTGTGVYAAFPQGSNGGQCGVFTEQITDFAGTMGDSFKSKMAVTDPNISAANNNITPGDIAVLNMGAFGHAAVVLGTSTVNGVTMVNVVESNIHGDGKVNYGQYDASKIGGYIPAQLKSDYQFGSGGAPLTSDQQALADFATDKSKKWEGNQTSAAGRPKDSSYLVDAGKLADDYAQNPVVKNFATEQQGLQFASNFDTTKNNASSDQALIFSFMKVLDPTSVVREGEYATAQNNAGVLQSYGVKLQNVLDGHVLSKTQRDSIITALKSKYNSDQTAYKNVQDQFTSRANSYGIDPTDVVTSYSISDAFGGGKDIAGSISSSSIQKFAADNGIQLSLTDAQAQDIAKQAQEMADANYSNQDIADALLEYIKQQ